MSVERREPEPGQIFVRPVGEGAGQIFARSVGEGDDVKDRTVVEGDDGQIFVRSVGEGDDKGWTKIGHVDPDWTKIGPVDLESVRVHFDSDTPAKPTVTRRQYEQARAVLDALPAGIYRKCECGRWQMGGAMHFTMDGPRCDTCRGA